MSVLSGYDAAHEDHMTEQELEAWFTFFRPHGRRRKAGPAKWRRRRTVGRHVRRSPLSP